MNVYYCEKLDIIFGLSANSTGLIIETEEKYEELYEIFSKISVDLDQFTFLGYL